jgi:hypothetical protein
MAASKRVCSVSRQEFAVGAKPLVADIRPWGSSDGAITVAMSPKQFSTDSLGWNGQHKASVLVGDKLVDVQIGVNVTIIGSKELPKVA